MSLAWRWAASPTLTNELRGGFLRSDTSFLNSNQYTKFLVGGLVFTSPINTFMQQGRKVNTYNVQDNATWSRRKHEIAFGFQGQICDRCAVQRRRNHPDLHARDQRRQSERADRRRSARYPHERPDRRQQSIREPRRDRQPRRPRRST